MLLAFLDIHGAELGSRGREQPDGSTVEPQFNKPLYNKVLSITNNILQPGQSYSKMYGTDPRYKCIHVTNLDIKKSLL